MGENEIERFRELEELETQRALTPEEQRELNDSIEKEHAEFYDDFTDGI